MSVPHGDVTLEPVDAVAGGWRQVHLVGFMGAGKSTVGQLLARRLLWNYVDLDALIERHAGARVAEIFESRGEEEFRQLERFVLRQAVAKPRTVVALGGGTFVDPENVRISRQHAVSVWLRCSPGTVIARLGGRSADRPLWDPSTAAARMEARRHAYERADLVVDAEDDAPQIADELVRRLSGSEIGRDRQ